MRSNSAMRNGTLGLLTGVLLALPASPSLGEDAAPGKPSLRFVIPAIEAKTRTPQGSPTPRSRVIFVTPSPREFWWNGTEMVEALELTPDQRGRMDAIMAEMEPTVRKSQQQQGDAREALDSAMREADWAAADKAAKDFEEGIGISWGIQNRIKIRILKELTPAQHEKLVGEYDHLLQASWSSGRRAEFRGGPATSGTQPADLPTPPTDLKTPPAGDP